MIYSINYIPKNNYKEKTILQNNVIVQSIFNNLIYIKSSTTIDTYILLIKNQIYSLIFNHEYLSHNLLIYYYLSLNTNLFTFKKNRSSIKYGHHLIEKHNINYIELNQNNHKYTFHKIQKISTITKSPIILSNCYMCLSDKNFLTLFCTDNKIIASFSLYDHDFNYINYDGYSLLDSYKNIKFTLHSENIFLNKKSNLQYEDLSSNMSIYINGSI